MGDAIWLFFGTPKWFLSNVQDPMAVGILSVFPFVGILCLVAGVALAVWRRNRFLWRFGLPFLGCQALVVVAGFLRGSLDNSITTYILAPFIAVMLGWSLFLVVRAKCARIAALLLAVFTLSYASYASFVSWMSFTDTWL